MFKVDENTKALLHFNDKNNLLKDDCGNKWTAHGTPLKFYNEDPYVGGSAFFDIDSCISLDNLNTLIDDMNIFTIECLFSLKKTNGTEKSYYSNRYLFQCYNTYYNPDQNDSTVRGWFSVYFYPYTSKFRNSYNTTTKEYGYANSFCGEKIYPIINLNGVKNFIEDTDSYIDDKVIYAIEDSWHHIAVSRDGNYLHIHLDGFLIYNANITNHFNWVNGKTNFIYYLIPGGVFRFGNAGNNLDTSNSFFGYISELRISDCDRYGGNQNYGKYSNIYNEFIKQTLLNYNNVCQRFPYTYVSNGKTLTGYYNINNILDSGSVKQWPINTTTSSNANKIYLYYIKNLEDQYSGKEYAYTSSVVEENVNKTDYTSEDDLLIHPNWYVNSATDAPEYRKFKYYPLLITNKSQKKYYFYPYNMSDDGETLEEIMDNLSSFIFTEEEDFIKYSSNIWTYEDPVNINNVNYRLRIFSYYPLCITNKSQKKYYYYYTNQDHAFNSFDEVMENIELFDLETEAEEEFIVIPTCDVVDVVTIDKVNYPVRAFKYYPLLITDENKKKFNYYPLNIDDENNTFDEVMEGIILFSFTEAEEEFTAIPMCNIVDEVTVNNVSYLVRAFKYYPLFITDENKKKFHYWLFNQDEDFNSFEEVMKYIALFLEFEEEPEEKKEITICPIAKIIPYNGEERYFDTDPLSREETGRFYKYFFNLTDAGDDISKYIFKNNFDTLKILISNVQSDTKMIIRDDFPIFMAYKYL